MKPHNPQDIFQAGGTLPADIPSYVERSADKEALDTILAGKFCYVLTARQMGKSSLRVRTMQRLSEKGYTCLSVDLSSIGSQLTTVEQWYFSFLIRLLDNHPAIKKSFRSWWKAQLNLSPVARLESFFHDFLLEKLEVISSA